VPLTRPVGGATLGPAGAGAREPHAVRPVDDPENDPDIDEEREEQDPLGEDGAGDELEPAPLERPPGPDDDHDLIRRAQRGEELAFETLVRRHQGRAWRVARNMVASDEDAQDLAQEAFLRVFRSLDRFDFRHDFTTWLYRIVTNLAIDHLRKKRPLTSTAAPDGEEADLDLADPSEEGPSAAVEHAETAEAVRDCLASLAPHFQSVLVLRELEGLACNRIAEIVGATHVTVRWRLHRGRKLFQEEWERRARLAESGGQGAGAPWGGPQGAPEEGAAEDQHAGRPSVGPVE
jgi:RNA polymerase sigma-70 factor, ECF subfamily